MAVNLTIKYQAQLIVELTSKGCKLPRVENTKVCDDFDAFIKKHLAQDYYKDVEIDPHYKRYGLDIGLISYSKEKLGDACHDIANYTQEQPYLRNILFESFA